MPGRLYEPAALYARLPIQFVFAWIVWWATRPSGRAGDESAAARLGHDRR